METKPSSCAPCAAGGALEGEHIPGCEIGEAEQGGVAVEDPGALLGHDLQGADVVPVDELRLVDLAVGVLEGDLDHVGAVRLHVDERDQTIRQQTAHRCPSRELLQPGHGESAPAA